MPKLVLSPDPCHARTSACSSPPDHSRRATKTSADTVSSVSPRLPRLCAPEYAAGNGAAYSRMSVFCQWRLQTWRAESGVWAEAGGIALNQRSQSPSLGIADVDIPLSTPARQWPLCCTRCGCGAISPAIYQPGYSIAYRAAYGISFVTLLQAGHSTCPISFETRPNCCTAYVASAVRSMPSNARSRTAARATALPSCSSSPQRVAPWTA